MPFTGQAGTRPGFGGDVTVAHDLTSALAAMPHANDDATRYTTKELCSVPCRPAPHRSKYFYALYWLTVYCDSLPSLQRSQTLRSMFSVFGHECGGARFTARAVHPDAALRNVGTDGKVTISLGDVFACHHSLVHCQSMTLTVWNPSLAQDLLSWSPANVREVRGSLCRMYAVSYSVW